MTHADFYQFMCRSSVVVDPAFSFRKVIQSIHNSEVGTQGYHPFSCGPVAILRVILPFMVPAFVSSVIKRCDSNTYCWNKGNFTLAPDIAAYCKLGAQMSTFSSAGIGACLAWWVVTMLVRMPTFHTGVPGFGPQLWLWIPASWLMQTLGGNSNGSSNWDPGTYVGALDWISSFGPGLPCLCGNLRIEPANGIVLSLLLSHSNMMMIIVIVMKTMIAICELQLWMLSYCTMSNSYSHSCLYPFALISEKC